MGSFNLIRGFADGDDYQATERAKLSLKTMMRLGTDFVDSLCDGPLADGTACYWADRGVEKDGTGNFVWKSPKCKRSQKRCKIDDFFAENRVDFIRIKDAIDATPEEEKSDQLKRFSEVIGKALVDPGMLLDYKPGCKQLADAIIAVDSKDYRSLFSQNERESSLLTRVLNQDFYYLPPNPDKGVLVQVNLPNTSTQA